MTPEKYQELKNEIINQAHYQDLKKYIAHGHTSCFEHSIRVADRCFKFINRYQVKCNHEALIKGPSYMIIIYMTGMIIMAFVFMV